MKRQSVLPLPRYTRRKWLKGAQHWAYYFEVPTWARKPATGDPRGLCLLASEELGTDYARAVARVEEVLLPQFESWRTNSLADLTPSSPVFETLDWLFSEYKATDEFKDLSQGQRKLHQDGFDLVGAFLLKDGRRLGSIKLMSIDTGVVDRLYQKLRYVPVLNCNGSPVLDQNGDPLSRERRTTINHAMKSCRRAWNIACRRNPKNVPRDNPFSRMGLKGSKRLTPTATYADLIATITKLDELGAPSLGTALMLTWEWLQREQHIFTTFQVAHYRPKDRPDEALILHPKNGEEVWVPLFEQQGQTKVPLFPELMGRLDTIKRSRIAGLMFYRDWNDPVAGVPLPWATESGDLTYVRHLTKKAIMAAGLAADLTFTSFRHGGLTELGDAELSDTEIRALSRQRTSKVLPRYIKRTRKQIIAGAKKRRATRTNEGNLSE